MEWDAKAGLVKVDGVVVNCGIIHMNFGNVIYINPRFSHKKWRDQVILHRWHMQCTMKEQEAGGPIDRAIISYNVINQWNGH